MDRDKALQVQRQLWSDANSLGLPAMRGLKAGVCAYDLVIGENNWFHKSNVGTGNDWRIDHGHCEGAPDIIVYFDASLDYPFCFEGHKNLEDLIAAFRAAAERGAVTFAPQRDMSVLVDKGYDKLAEALALQPRKQAAVAD